MIQKLTYCETVDFVNFSIFFISVFMFSDIYKITYDHKIQSSALFLTLLSLSLTLSHSHSLSVSLQSYQSLSSPSVSSDLPSIVVCPLQYFGDVSKTVSELREKLEDFLKGEWTKISTTGVLKTIRTSTLDH